MELRKVTRTNRITNSTLSILGTLFRLRVLTVRLMKAEHGRPVLKSTLIVDWINTPESLRGTKRSFAIWNPRKWLLGRSSVAGNSYSLATLKNIPWYRILGQLRLRYSALQLTRSARSSLIVWIRTTLRQRHCFTLLSRYLVGIWINRPLRRCTSFRIRLVRKIALAPMCRPTKMRIETRIPVSFVSLLVSSPLK